MCITQKIFLTYFILANLLTPPLSPSKNKNSSAIEHAQTKKTKVDEFKSEEAAEEDDEDEDGPEDNDEFEDEDDDLYDNKFEDDEANKGMKLKFSILTSTDMTTLKVSHNTKPLFFHGFPMRLRGIQFTISQNQLIEMKFF